MKTLSYVVQFDVDDDAKWTDQRLIDVILHSLTQQEKKEMLSMALVGIEDAFTVVPKSLISQALYYFDILDEESMCEEDLNDLPEIRDELKRAIVE